MEEPGAARFAVWLHGLGDYGRANEFIADHFSAAKTARDEKEVLRAVEHVHELLDKEVAAGTSASDIFVCGMSQGGALAIASVLLYPKILGGCLVFSGSVQLSKSFAEKVLSEARKVIPNSYPYAEYFRTASSSPI
ncbi:probable carboxylesterase Os04g0669600 [Phragmites australis]|uniref:probable carboxylesterase Os04g0669600 n=1 Tax=Phragmites australis TaxID=29695 RepID=UPI002D77F645|nr:probable carboxylesterase Os04g0669600 [Phragmites australis]